MFKKLKKNKKFKSRVVILGGGGFVSSAVEKKLKKAQIKFLVLKRKNLDLTKKNSEKKLSRIIKSEDTILFIAARAPVKNIEMFNANINMCQITLKAIKSKNINHFIYLSSDAVYSDIKTKINESSITQPESLHGIMHLTRELLFKSVLNSKICIIRPTLIFGKNDPHNGYGPNRFLRLAKSNKKIKLFGKGEEKRDHVYLEDVSEVIVGCILDKGVGVLNVVSGEVISFNNLAKFIVKNIESESTIENTQRIGLMPHNGFRPFSHKLLKKNFPHLKSFSFKKILKEHIKKI